MEAAVLETARGGILREGLGFDHCDVGILTNIGKGDHFGLRGIETLAELAGVKRTLIEAVAPDGIAVLNADDPLVVDMAEVGKGTVTYFTGDERNSVVAAHRAAGGRAVFARAGSLMMAVGTTENELLPLSKSP